MPRLTENLAQRADRGFLAAGIAAVLWLAFTVIVAPQVFPDGPTRTVTDYLDALRARDADGALAAAGVTRGDAKPYDTSFLTSEALSSDWDIASVWTAPGLTGYDAEGFGGIETDDVDEAHTVHAVIRHGDLSMRGAFLVQETDAGYRILNPFAYAGAGDVLGIVGLGGVTASTHPGTDRETKRRTFALFPGLYRLFRDSEQVRSDPATTLAMPAMTVGDQLEAAVSLTPAGRRSAGEAVRSRVDHCAKSTKLSPPGCPFFATDDDGHGIVSVHGRDYGEVSHIRWKVLEEPRVDVVIDDVNDSGGFSVVQDNDARVRLTGVGVDIYSDSDKPGRFSVDCPIAADQLWLALTSSDTFAVSLLDNAHSDHMCE